VAFDGNDVYIKLLHPLSAEGTQGIWIKGTVNGETATFAKGQSLGSYDTTPLYLAGSTGKDVTDVTFIISHILQKTPEGFNAEAADINGDGYIDVTDVTFAINIILGKQ
jgi:hypothetical protein